MHGPRFLHVVTECIPLDLFAFMQQFRSQLTSDVVAVLVRDATAGILYLQRHGLCHRDIKPENLLVSMSRHDINLKVCDFRLCAFVEQELAHAQTNKLLDNAATEAGVEDEDKEDILQYAALSHREPILLSDFAGSPGFFAPEILLQRSYNGYSADLWSLGCVALELLARPSFFNHAWLGVYKVLHTAQAPEFQQQLRQAVVAAVEEVRIVHGTGSSATLTNKTEAVSLMSALLDFNISSRPTATEALKHPWLARADRFHAVATLNKCANAGTAAVRVPGVHSTTNSATILPTNLQMHASNSLTEFGKNSFSAKIESITGRQYQDEKQSLCRGSTMPFRMCPAVISPISSSEGSPFGSAAVSAEPTPLNTPRDNFSHSPCTSRPASAEKRSLNLTFAASTLSPTNRSALYNAADRTANQRFTNSNTCEELSQDIRSDAILDIEETPLGHEDGTFSGGVTAPLVPPAPSTLCQQHPAELQIFFQADSTRSNHTVGHACEIKARRKGRRQSTVANGAAYRAPESSASFPIQPTDLPFSTPSISQESGKSNEFSAPGTVPVYNLGIDELARLLEQRMGQFEPAAQPVTAPTSSAGPGVLTQLRPSLMLGTPLSEDEDEEEGVSNDGLVSPLISILPADPCLARMENCIEDSILNINTSLNTCSMQDPVLHKYPPKLLDSTKDPLQTRAILPQAQSHVHFKMAADDEPEKSAVREPHALHFQHDPSQVGHCANVMHEATKSAAQFPLVQTLQPSTSLTLPMPYVLQSKRRRDSITLLAMKSKKSAWSKAHADGTKTLCKRVVLDRFRDKRSFPQMQVLLQEAGVDERGRNLASRANTAISTANIHPSISPPHPAASTRLPHNPYLFTVPHNEIHTHSASITKGGSRKLFV